MRLTRVLLLLLAGAVCLSTTTMDCSIQRLQGEMAETRQALEAVHRAALVRDAEIARRLERDKTELEDRLTALEEPDLSGVLAALDNTVTVLVGGGHGSGVVLANGYVLTARHCADSGTPIQVRALDGAVYDVNEVHLSEDYDVALLEVPGIEGGIELCPADELALFNAVYVIGAPVDVTLAGSISQGIFASFDVDYWSWEGAYRVTCDAHPGNSGGPVVDTRGRLVGLVVGGPDPGGAVTIVEPMTHILELLNGIELNE